MGFSTVQIDIKTAVELAKKMQCTSATDAKCLNGVIPWDKVIKADKGDNGHLYLTFKGAYPAPFAEFELSAPEILEELTEKSVPGAACHFNSQCENCGNEVDNAGDGCRCACHEYC